MWGGHSSSYNIIQQQVTSAVGDKNHCYSTFVLKVLTNVIRQEKEAKSLNIEKEKTRLSLLEGYLIVYRENQKTLTEILLKPRKIIPLDSCI